MALGVSERALTTRELNRSLLARQLLLERSRLPLAKALEQVGGLQAQYAPSSYIRLWSSLEGFARDDLTRALERKRAVQGTLMRSTIHVVSARDYWLFSAGVGPSQQEWWLRTHGKQFRDADLEAIAATLRKELAGGRRSRKEVDELLRSHGSTIWSGAWVELIRVPPSGTWERRRADVLQLASEWLGPAKVIEVEGIEHLLRRYLGAFGPARLDDAAKWAGVARPKMRATAERLKLRRFLDEDGTHLVDLPRAPLPGADTPAPVRFLPTWDATLLVHARRTQILPDRFRERIFHVKTPHSFATFLVDGAVAGAWRVERTAGKATLVIEPFEPLPRGARKELEGEGAGLVQFHEPDASSFVTRVARPS
jgi:winged helix DNA-binding protein